MATSLAQQKFSINLSSVIDNALISVKKVRDTNQSKKEQAFQEAVADGMSYEGQVAFRKKQLEDEKASPFSDPDYVESLTKTVSDLNRLNRFNKYRTRYAKSFGSLKAGTETAQQHLDVLRGMLDTTTDPDLRQEIQNNIVDAEGEVKTSQNNILSNQVKKAQYDGTTAMLSSAVSSVKDRKALAVLNGNEEEASALDATLSVLGQQLNKVKVQDATDKLEVSSISKGLTPAAKLTAMNSEIAASDNTDPVTIDGKTYPSVADYWTQTRDSYLSGNGKGIFSDFFKELDATITNKINGAISRDGFATTLTLDGVKGELDTLKGRPEVAPFLQQLENLQSVILANAFKSTADTILERASYTGDFRSADTALTNYSTKYGIDSQSYRLKLGNILTQQVDRAASANNTSPAQVEKESGLTGVLPATDFPTPVAPDAPAPAAPGTPAAPKRVFSPKENVDLAAAQARVASGNGSPIDKQNVAFATKQGWVAPPPPMVPVAPASPDNATPTIIPAPAPTPTPTVPIPAPAAPTPAPAPAAPASVSAAPTPSSPAPKPYAGTSIVDYLGQQKQDSSYAARAKLAATHGINDYAGTAEQNSTLLNKLRGQM